MTDDIRARIDAAILAWEDQNDIRDPEAAAIAGCAASDLLREVLDLIPEPIPYPNDTDEGVEAAAEAVHYRIWPQANWDDMPEQYREDIRAQERAALSIVLGIERKTEGVSATTHADDDREALNGVLVNVLSNVSNFPERAQSRLLGQDMGPLRGMVVDAVLTSDVWRNRCKHESLASRDEILARLESALNIKDGA